MHVRRWATRLRSESNPTARLRRLSSTARRAKPSSQTSPPRKRLSKCFTHLHAMKEVNLPEILLIGMRLYLRELHRWLLGLS
jgi:hypothetical protein